MKTKEPLPSDKTIKFSVHFWTNNIAEKEGHIVPRNAQSRGTVALRANPSHGIKASESIIFNSLMELPTKIEELLIREGITLHAKGNMGRYFKSE